MMSMLQRWRDLPKEAKDSKECKIIPITQVLKFELEYRQKLINR